MPAFLTHLLAANDSFGRLNTPDRDLLSFHFSTYLWGALGPDPLYFHNFATGRSPLPGYASTMHDYKPKELLASIGRYVAANKEHPQYQMLVAYQAGFYSHYHLDSITHPYIHSQAELFAGLSPDRVHGGSHHRIEADISSVLYRMKTGQGVHTFSPRRRLSYSRDTAVPIAALLCHALGEVYGILLPPEAVVEAFDDTINAQILIHDPTGFLAYAAASVADIFRGSGTTPLASRVCREDVSYDVLGRAHREWLRCDDRSVSSCESFTELFDQAVDTAASDIDRILQTAVTGEVFAPDYSLRFNEGAPGSGQI